MLEIIRSAQTRGRSRAAVTSKMECFVVIVNGFQPLTIITKHSICFQPLTIITKHFILDVAAVLDPPLSWFVNKQSVPFATLKLDMHSVRILTRYSTWCCFYWSLGFPRTTCGSLSSVRSGSHQINTRQFKMITILEWFNDLVPYFWSYNFWKN